MEIKCKKVRWTNAVIQIKTSVHLAGFQDISRPADQSLTLWKSQHIEHENADNWVPGLQKAITHMSEEICNRVHFGSVFFIMRSIRFGNYLIHIFERRIVQS